MSRAARGSGLGSSDWGLSNRIGLPIYRRLQNPLHWLGIAFDLTSGHLFMAKKLPPKPETAKPRPVKSGPSIEQAPAIRPSQIRRYERRESALRLVGRIRKSDPPLYRKIAAATDASDPNLEAIITVLLSEEARLKSVARRHDVFRLIFESLTAMVYDGWWSFAMPMQEENLINLLRKSLDDDDLQVRPFAVRRLDFTSTLAAAQARNSALFRSLTAAALQTEILRLHDRRSLRYEMWTEMSRPNRSPR